MKALTFFTLLIEGNKWEVYERRFALTASAFPHMEKDTQEEVQEALALPDDVLEDILEEENVDDIATIKKTLEGK